MKPLINTKNMMENAVVDDPKSSLLRYITDNPGVRYRELSRLSGLSNGTLSYNLFILEKLNQIRVDRSKSKVTRYYLFNVPKTESYVIGYIRNRIARQIITFILDHNLCTFSEIVDCARKAPSTVSWHLKRLKDAGIILVTLGDECTLYRVINREQVNEILSKYQESFIDAAVENYKEIMEKL